MKKLHLIMAALAILIFITASSSQNTRSLYFSNQYAPNAAAMPQTESFTVDDPIYLVLSLSSSNRNTLADVASIEPHSGRKNFWLCFNPNTTMQTLTNLKPKCVGIFAEPVTDAALTGKAVSYKILPAGNEIANRTELSEDILKYINASRSKNFVTIPFVYYIYGKADRALETGDVSIDVRNWDLSETGKYMKRLKDTADAQWDAETKKIVTEYVTAHKSRRVDPQLEKAIKAWWRGAPTNVVINPILRIDFVEADYEYTRNDYGVVLRKTVDAFYVFKRKSDGKCFVNTRSFGYESLGGGAFSTEPKAWVKRDDYGYPDSIKLSARREIEAGRDTEVDCAPFGG